MANIRKKEDTQKKLDLKTATDTQKFDKKPINSLKKLKNRTAEWWDFKRFLDENWKFRYDVVRNRLMWCGLDNDEYKEVLPSNLFGRVQSHFGKLPKNYIFDVVMDDRIAPQYNPLKSWFKKYKCNQDIDYIKQLCGYIILKNDTYEERERLYLALKKWFVGAIKTLFEPKYVHKQCIVWQGAQGIGKTPFVESLLPNELQDFVNSLRNLNLDSKDAKIALTSYFLINIDEIDQFFKTKINRDNYKSYLTTRLVNVRLPYTRTDISRLRIAAFMGSCNETIFLNDTTGTQRFTIFAVDKFLNKKHGDGQYIEDFPMRNVWTYAYNEYIKKYSPEYTLAEELLNEQANDAYKLDSDEYNTILEWLEPASKSDAGSANVEFMNATQIRKYLNEHLKDNGVYFPSTNKIGEALTALGFSRLFKKINKKSVRGYYVRKIKVEPAEWTAPVTQQDMESFKQINF